MSAEKSRHGCQGIGSWIVSTAHAFRRALECQLADQGVTFRQWEVMAWLDADGQQPQADLAEKMGLEAQTLAGIIARMERDGWLTRENCAHDRRRKLISATAKTETIWAEMSACCEQVKQQAMLGLSELELSQLETICDRIRQNLDVNCVDHFNDRLAVQRSSETNVRRITPAQAAEETHSNWEDTV